MGRFQIQNLRNEKLIFGSKRIDQSRIAVDSMYKARMTHWTEDDSTVGYVDRVVLDKMNGGFATWSKVYGRVNVDRPGPLTPGSIYCIMYRSLDQNFRPNRSVQILSSLLILPILNLE